MDVTLRDPPQGRHDAATSSLLLPHRHADRGRLLPARRHPAVRAAGASRCVNTRYRRDPGSANAARSATARAVRCVSTRYNDERSIASHLRSQARARPTQENDEDAHDSHVDCPGPGVHACRLRTVGPATGRQGEGRSSEGCGRRSRSGEGRCEGNRGVPRRRRDATKAAASAAAQRPQAARPRIRRRLRPTPPRLPRRTLRDSAARLRRMRARLRSPLQAAQRQSKRSVRRRWIPACAGMPKSRPSRARNGASDPTAVVHGDAQPFTAARFAIHRVSGRHCSQSCSPRERGRSNTLAPSRAQ